ncbi:MAG: AAA family ATPase [Chlorobiaceae bacterium]|nr:AAA family ATPase [Chlorobiaceae bacterium]
MINVIGNGDSPEYQAAAKISFLARRAWPWLVDDDESYLWIVPGVQCHGQLPRDIDIVVFGYFSHSKDYSFRPAGLLTLSNGVKVEPSLVRVDSLCLTIEVKDHGQGHVRFLGTKVEVQYSSGWHDASDQSSRQLYSLKNYLETRNARVIPRITNLIWLRNVAPHQLPSPPHNILHGNVTWNGLLYQAASTSQIIKVDNLHVFSALNKQRYEEGVDVLDKVIDALVLKLTPTELDRQKMDAMSRVQYDDRLHAVIGEKMILMRGHGGTGKTMFLLQIAYRRSTEGNNALILTYNKALVADIRRTMALARVSDEFSYGSIQVMTVQSFFHGMLRAYGAIGIDEDGFLDNYLTYLEAFAASIEEALVTNLQQWDLLLIDEGQDWPEIERSLIFDVYGSNRLVVADGMQQLVRGQKPCNWSKDLSKEQYEEVRLLKGWRMKRNLANFSNRIAELLGLGEWHVDENGEAFGGRIIVVEGRYMDRPQLHASLIDAARSMKNCPVDLLACVPPRHGASIFEILGQEVWDGTSSLVRGGYPTSVEQLRVVQYESCRGLEGWSVINLGFDVFHKWKLDSWGMQVDAVPGEFEDDEIAKNRFAARWVMIALTRAIDTIVIEVSKQPSSIKKHLKSLHAGPCKDFMEWIHA